MPEQQFSCPGEYFLEPIQKLEKLNLGLIASKLWPIKFKKARHNCILHVRTNFLTKKKFGRKNSFVITFRQLWEKIRDASNLFLVKLSKMPSKSLKERFWGKINSLRRKSSLTFFQLLEKIRLLPCKVLVSVVKTAFYASGKTVWGLVFCMGKS